MGGCVSALNQTGEVHSKEIDKLIKESFKREHKILLLGLGESGKSTIVKQLKIMDKEGFTDAELAEYRPIVYKNVLDSAQAVIIYMRKTGWDFAGFNNRPLADKVLDYRLDTEASNSYFPQDIAEAIHQLWKDPIITKIMDEHSSEFYLMDSAAYFFGEIIRIGSANYLPDVTDVLRARQKSVGITETRFTMGQLSTSLSIHMFDVPVSSQRLERKKWIYCLESVTSIIFCTALSEYDQGLLEEKSQNRMVESLILFESVINSRWFLRTSIILFLNKIDVFKHKLQKVPLERYFPEYTGGSDISKATKYILWKFLQTNRARLSVYPHITQLTDTMDIQLVFAVMKETISQNILKDSGIL